SKDLIEILFMHPYTKIDFLVNIMGLHRETASIYLREMEKLGLLNSLKIGRSKYFINTRLFNMLKKGI
ncbi:MAG: Fic family protein, partial [Sulfurimonas sp.]|nr:Fic family protein [Sulfurimonas sp.]